MADRYPILVERLDSSNALVMGCNGCGRQVKIDDPDRFIEAVDCGSCPHCDAFSDFVPAFEPGSRCKGCGKMAIEQPVDGCCSRRCVLQAEYAARLEARNA